MKMEILTVCDFANAEPATGKLNVIGAFDHIWAQQEPIVHMQCAIAAKLRFELGEEGPKKLAVTFIDADGRAVLPTITVQMIVQFQPNEPTATAPIAAIISQLNLPHFGEYTVGIAVDGRMEGSVPLYVRQVPGRPQAQSGQASS
jgi:hypothetical protein